MNEVGNHQNAVFLKHGVSGCVSVCRNGLDVAFQHVTGFKKMEVILIGRKNVFGQLPLLTFNGKPCLSFYTVHIYFGTGECHFIVLQQAADMVGVQMGEVD